MWSVLKLIVIAAAVAVVVSTTVTATEPGCLEWSKAGPIIAQNSLLPANVVYQMVQKKTGGKIVNQALCDLGATYVYKLVVLGPTGEVTNVTVDARTGQF
jgi:uncharacterized membrane protein YkoI